MVVDLIFILIWSYDALFLFLAAVVVLAALSAAEVKLVGDVDVEAVFVVEDHLAAVSPIGFVGGCGSGGGGGDGREGVFRRSILLIVFAPMVVL